MGPGRIQRQCLISQFLRDTKTLGGSKHLDPLGPVAILGPARGVPVSLHERTNPTSDHQTIVDALASAAEAGPGRWANGTAALRVCGAGAPAWAANPVLEISSIQLHNFQNADSA
jgi:hypothetical protein